MKKDRFLPVFLLLQDSAGMVFEITGSDKSVLTERLI